MKILLVGAENGYNLEGLYLRALKSLGHKVVLLDQYQGVGRRFLNRFIYTRASAFRWLLPRLPVNRLIFHEVKTLEPDLIIVFKGELIDTDIIRALSQGYKVALYYPDGLNYKVILRDRLQYFNTVFVAGNIKDGYYKLGARKVVTIPYACDPQIHRMHRVDKEYNVSFIGTFDLDRYKLLKKINNVDVFGDHWMIKAGRHHPSVYGEDFIRTINETKINLNLHKNSDSKVDGVNMRTFEVTGAGGFLLSSYIPSIFEYFKKDEVDVFETAKEAQEKIDYYLGNGWLLEEMANRAQLHCYRDHTYINRAKQILDAL
ncbi:MAG: glycosyltransferase [Nitrososphaerota archaeon]|nr:glycosyltransferase [Nitrososphaerota archaeon]